MDKEYYVPKVWDLREGYECEIYSIKLGWKRYIIGDDYENLTFSRAKSEAFYGENIRVPHLTKEQIEAEGWKHSGKSIDIWFEIEGSFEMGSWTAYRAKLQYGLHDQRLRIFVIDTDNTEYDCFRGICPSINEFRFITKLIGINA